MPAIIKLNGVSHPVHKSIREPSSFARAIDASHAGKGIVGGHAAQGGLQNHSLGSLYPLIVYGQETSQGLRYGILLASGEHDTGGVFVDCGDALKQAQWLKSDVVGASYMKRDRAIRFVRESFVDALAFAAACNGGRATMKRVVDDMIVESDAQVLGNAPRPVTAKPGLGAPYVGYIARQEAQDAAERGEW